MRQHQRTAPLYLSMLFAALFAVWSLACNQSAAQTAGNSGTLSGIVTDSTGAIIPNASVTIANPVSGLNRTTKADNAGRYQFSNLPLNPYNLSASAPGFDTPQSVH